MRIMRQLAFTLGLPVILIVIWWLATLGSTSFFVPQPAQLAAELVNVWLGPRLLEDVVPSVVRLIAGLALAIVVGIALGLTLGTVRWLRRLTEPLFEFLRAIPATILVPVLLLIIGINDTMKIAVIVFGCVWPILLNTIEGARAVDQVLTDTAKIYGLNGLRRVRALVLRSATPQIMVGIRQSLSIGLILMVISELFASTNGIGFAIVQFQRLYQIPEMWSGIVVLGLLGLGLSAVFRLIQARVLFWYYGSREGTGDGA